ncbi:cobalt-zinc-cadmium resistance protein CzcA [Sphingobacterium allocomposti]|uniref:Cobalt-zinc-cadmium resistance protein CzcA n=1 Tax=Sphingobacterium allocomposti TaxID=415956 RepID=A0A5S5DH24_9SPHI|nr:CusA/CzcA family heavy metal efflux RND transporter [Sphingobacterium composti Yoo et al. 2007 non Ten et al. 2007]TYP94446.1 cobalt-zinc-cadmium resistance protein CzcA [Sphingobacterium composti Yoo et al. 2007 non Ten et al. 2007]
MLDNIIKFSVKNKFIIGLMTLLLIIWGVWSATKIPIDAQPDITNNQVQIITLCPTLAGQEVEQLVTFPVEQSIVNLPKVEEIRSISRFGLSVVTVVFQDDVDIYFARQLVNEKLKEAEEQIPEGVGTPELSPVSTGLGEVYQYILHPKKGSEDKYSAMDLRTMQDWIVARQLYGTPGVAEVNSFGGLLKQYEVSVDPNRIKAMDVSISDIFTALETNNQNTGGAYIDKKPNAYFIRGIGLVTTLEDVGNIVVKNTGSIPVYIKDVAEVKFGNATRYGAMTYNGEVDAVGGIVMMLKGDNSAAVVNRIKEKLPVIQQSLPEDVVIEAYLDRTDLVGRAISTVQKNLIEGALIVIFVLILFLGNIRAGLIVASAIPLSMLFALAMMRLFGVSANLMSLGAIDFGLIVDGSLIVVEATMHHLGLRKSTQKLTQNEMDDEVFESARKIRTSAAFGEIIILIVYIPILTLVGIEGKMFTPMAQTVGFAILGALILSFTYIPMMSALCLSKKPITKKNFSDKMMDYLQGIYKPLLEKAIRIKYIVIAIAVGLFTISIFLFSRMGGEFLPKLGEGDFAFHCILPQGTSLSQSLETSMQASRIIKEFDEVKMVVGKTGAAEVPTDPMPPEATDLMIILKPRDEWKTDKSYDELSNEMMEKLEVIPGVFFEANQPIQMRFNELMTGIRQDVAVKIFGENLDSLLIYANKANSIIQTVEGATAPQVERVAGLPQINIEYDRTRIANYGLNVQDINDIVSTAFAGKSAGVVYENERRFDLVVRLDEAHRSSIEDVNNLFIPLPNGEQVPLSQVATIDYKLGPAQISREDGKRRIYVGFNVQGRDVASVVEEIQDKLAEQIKLPTGYYFTYGGQFENLQKATDRLLIAVPIALLLIFILLYFTFHSFKEAILVYTAIPMSAIGGVFALLLRDMPFSISAGVGFIALFGVAVLNGIVLIATFNRLEKEGWNEIIPRIIEGAKTRLRPVLMTASVASLGFLPMALSTSAGAEVQKPLATVVIGGLISATALTLFVLPLLYLVFMRNNRPPKNNKMKAITPVVLVLLFLGFSPISNAQSSINVDKAIDIAMENNPQLRSKNLDIQSVQSLSKTAFELPKTDVNFQYGNNEGFEYNDGIQISQTIPFPTLFGSKKDLVKEQVKGQQWAKALTENELKQQVRSYYYQLAYLENNAAVLKRLDSIYTDFIRVAELRYKTGDIGRLDVSTAVTKQGEINLLFQQNETLRQNAYQNLKNLMQINEEFVIESRSDYEPLLLTSVMDSSAIENHPSIQLLYQEAKIAEQNKKVERANGLPDFMIGYNNVSLIGMHSKNGVEQFYGRGQRFSFFDVGVSIPLTFGATKARIRSLDYQKQSLEQNAQWQEKQLKTELTNALKQYEQYVAQFTYFKEQALPNADEIIQAAKLGYSTGEISYVEYLFALQTTSDIQLNYLKSIQQINESVTLIHSLISK